MNKANNTCSQCDGWGFWYPNSTNREINWHMAARVLPDEGILGAPGFLTTLSMRQPVPLACPECGGRPGAKSPSLQA